MKYSRRSVFVMTRVLPCVMMFASSVICTNLSFAQSSGVVQRAAATPASYRSPNRIIALRTFKQDDATSSVTQDNGVTPDSNYQVEQRLSPELAKWPDKSIRDINVDIRDPSPNVPRNRASDLQFTNLNVWTEFQPSQKVFAWAAPNIKYQPLYLEDVALERYGQARGEFVQSFASAAHFFTSGLMLPYSMFADHPHSCDHPLGFCRPGNVVPATRQRLWFGFNPRQ